MEHEKRPWSVGTPVSEGTSEHEINRLSNLSPDECASGFQKIAEESSDHKDRNLILGRSTQEKFPNPLHRFLIFKAVLAHGNREHCRFIKGQLTPKNFPDQRQCNTLKGAVLDAEFRISIGNGGNGKLDYLVEDEKRARHADTRRARSKKGL